MKKTYINKKYQFGRLTVFNCLLASLMFLFVGLGTVNEIIQVEMPLNEKFYVSILAAIFLMMSFSIGQQFCYGFYCVYKIELTEQGVKWKNFISSRSMFYEYDEVQKIRMYNFWPDVLISLRSQLSSYETNYAVEMRDGKKFYLSGNIKGIDTLIATLEEKVTA